MNPFKLYLFFFSSFLLFGITSDAQKLEDKALQTMVSALKADTRGPYKDIRWFCKNGSTVSPQERCPGVGGVQRARYKNEIIALGKSNHIFLGQILSTTENKDFWDEGFHHSRLKQYQLEIFLRANDDGWVNRKAQFYRGAYQVEDEEAWGIEFYKWLLSDATRLKSDYFLIRQSAKDLPHAADNNLSQSVRAISKEISDQVNSFMDLRVKIHGQPEFTDIQRVKDYKAKNDAKLSAAQILKIEALIKDMELLYAPVKAADFKAYASKFPLDSRAKAMLDSFMQAYASANGAQAKCELISRTSLELRSEMLESYKSTARLALIDMSNKLEVMLLREAGTWQPLTLQEQMQKVYCLAAAAAGFGYVEDWEWRDISPTLKPRTDADMSLNELNDYNDHARRMVEWGTGMVRANYADVLKLYGGFEPLSIGFIDDKVRASVLLPLGDEVSELGDLFSRKAGFSNKVMSISAQSSIRGLNPGYAMGELVVTDRSPEEIEVASDKIYVFDRPPADLKPVAGIATVTEGNMVSHVQLLARNLGIPNAVLSKDNLKSLMAYNGKMVFYAVSNKGTVILKPASEMTAEEQDLFSKKIRSEEKITVPIELMELSNPHVLNLREVNAKHSGRLCGPKAANLGQLKQMYPTHVVEGLVIPFSIFRMHFDQDMPGTKLTYWGYLKEIFSQAEIMTAQECSEADIEIFTLQRLEVLRAAIKKMPLKNEFKAEMKDCFREVLGSEIGGVPVFLRSDTNMEDLKDFTGAGLNLTLFNVLDQEKIWEGIKDVWASPYTERSYRWRQRYLLNPENVFPSILIIPSVNADYSGVMITKGVSTGNDDDITVAFNRGVGGAVEGQASESWLLKAGGKNLLLSPAREPEFTSIPATGGTEKLYATLEERLLTDAYLKALRTMAGSLKTDLKALGIKGPYDVELGFKDDKIWLFQVRPFVENKKATASDYLRSITPEVNGNERISLNSKIK